MSTIINATTTNGVVIQPDNSGSLVLQTNSGTTALTIDTAQRAAFVAGTAALPAITTTGDTNTGMWFPAADTIAFAEGGAEAMRLDSSGNVGVGTTNPSPKITVARTATTSVTNASYYLGLGGTENLVNSKRLIGMGYSSGSTDEYPTAMGYEETDNGGFTNGAIAFYTRSVTTNTAPSERMRINHIGNVLMGTTTYVNLDSRICSWVAAGKIALETNSTTTAQYYPAIYYNNGATAGFISVTGTTTTYNSISDYRLKENIVPITGALATVQALKPVTYTWKLDGSNGQGFIAHELQEIVPDCVSGEKDAVETYTDEDGNEQTRIKPQGVDTSFLVATLTAAIQEQQTIINDLKARIETLEAK
jgi:hypothetical protein